MYKLNFDDLPIAGEQTDFRVVLQARMYEHKWNLVIWMLFVYPLFLLILALLILDKVLIDVDWFVFAILGFCWGFGMVLRPSLMPKSKKG